MLACLPDHLHSSLVCACSCHLPSIAVLDDCIEYLRDADDPNTTSDKTRRLGLVVARGTQVSLICPSEEMEEIANPYLDNDEDLRIEDA